MAPRTVEEILSKRRSNNGGLIAILQDVQSEHGYLSREALSCVAEKTGRPFVDVYAVATFFKSFSLKPRGEHLVCVCTGTACHVRGAQRILDEFARVLGVQAGQTTADGKFTLETVNCLGACALGPIVLVDRHYFSNVETVKVEQIVDQCRNGFEKSGPGSNETAFPVEVTCPSCGNTLMDPQRPIGAHPSIRLQASFGDTQTSLFCSGLYGNGERKTGQTITEQTIPEGTVLELSCPHCKGSLSRDGCCPECGSPMAVLSVGQGCVLRLCARYGCDGHTLDVDPSATSVCVG